MEEVPQDPYMLNRRGFPVRSKKIAPVDDKLRRFLEYDGKVLRYRTKVVKITLMYSQTPDFLDIITISRKSIINQNNVKTKSLNISATVSSYWKYIISLLGTEPRLENNLAA